MNILGSNILRRLAVSAVLLSAAECASAEPMTSCTMTYKLSGWSLVYKQYDGVGHISCSNGQRAQVGLSSKSIGFTIGKSEIEGTGIFSAVRNLNEIYGHYVAFEGHAGLTTSIDGQLLTSGEISLVLSGKGRGVDIGVTLGALRVSPR
jgi:hypothetical protein